MKTVSNTSSLMELAESRNNITTSSNSEENSQEKFYAQVKIAVGHSGSNTVNSMTDFSEVVAAYNRGAQVYLTVSTVGMVMQQLIINIPLVDYIQMYDGTQMLHFQDINVNIANGSLIARSLNWGSDNAINSIIANYYIDDTQSPVSLSADNHIITITAEGTATISHHV